MFYFFAGPKSFRFAGRRRRCRRCHAL